MMAEFDFSNVKATKSTAVPQLKRARQTKPNPLAPIYAESDKVKDANGHGTWLYLDLPGKTEQTDKGVTYGSTVKQAMSLLRQAAANKDQGVSFRIEEPNKDNGLKDGTLRVHFQAKPKRGSDS